nr:MAG TPA: hypothetical protein [Caudoviricetes sp.]
MIISYPNTRGGAIRRIRLWVSLQRNQGFGLHDQRPVYEQAAYRIGKIFFQPQGFRLDNLGGKGNSRIRAGHDGSRIRRLYQGKVIGFINLESRSRTHDTGSQSPFCRIAAGADKALILLQKTIHPRRDNKPPPYTGDVVFIHSRSHFYNRFIGLLRSAHVFYCNIASCFFRMACNMLINYIAQSIGGPFQASIHKINISLGSIHIIHLQGEIFLLVNNQFGGSAISVIIYKVSSLDIVLNGYISNLVDFYTVPHILDFAFIIPIDKIAQYEVLIQMRQQSCRPQGWNKRRNCHLLSSFHTSFDFIPM